MSAGSQSSRRRDWMLAIVVPIAGITLVAAICGTVDARTAMAQTAVQGDSLIQPSARDSNSVHKSLGRTIQQFEDAWRKEWQSHWRPLTRTEENFGAPDVRQPRLRRQLAMGCYARTPGKQSLAITDPPLHPVFPKPDRGSLCPSWSPPDLPLPPDEGEAIDLALPTSARETIRITREVLIKTLETAHQRYPNDAWIAAQMVRFVYDQRDPARTLAAARSCRGNVSECAELVGLALQQSGQIVAAESAFRFVDSLLLAPVANRKRVCIDPNVIVLFNPSDQERIRDQSCEGQMLFAENTWWLGDPLWSVQGNERYVEHGSRRIHRELRDLNSRDERYVWQRDAGGNALRETIIRYGWPSFTYWLGPFAEQRFAHSMDFFPPLSYRRPPGSRMPIAPVFVPPPLRIVAFPFTTKEYSSDRTALLPAYKAIAEPFSLTESHYRLTNPDTSYIDAWWPHEHMMLGLKIALLDSGQSVQLRRDSSILYQLAIDDPLRNLDAQASGASLAMLCGGPDRKGTRELARAAIAEGLTLRLKANLPSAPIVMSAEILPRSELESARRLRFGLRPPPTLREMKSTEVALSDPVFMRLPNREMSVPVEEASVLRYMAGTVAFAKSELFALYWESYGFIPGDTVQIELRIRRDGDVNVGRRIGSLFGIASVLRDSISIKWSEPDGRRTSQALSAARPAVGRSLALDLNALAPGTYLAIIEMRKGTLVPVRSERRFNITER